MPPGPLGEQWNTEDGKTVPMHSPEMPGGMDMNMGHDSGMDGMSGEAIPVDAASVEATPVDTAADAPDASTQPAQVIETDEGTTVILSDNRFAPKEITVKTGTPLTFINEGANWHSVAGANGLINVDQLASGASYTVVIDEPGTYNLICKHHLRQGMTAKLIVTD